MKTGFLPGVVVVLILCGCASPPHPLHGNSINSGTTQEFGESGTSSSLMSGCRVPCNVSPGQGCC
jgi:hypothetical protein